MTIVLDPKQNPKHLDLQITSGTEAVSWQCIYSLDGDELRLCMPLAPKKGQDVKENPNVRPKSFDTKDKPIALITAKRAKP